ncbi:ribonuclease H-like domain-containing protein [Tanacetum coccineum]
MKKKQYRRRAQIALEEKNQKSNGFGMTRYATMKCMGHDRGWEEAASVISRAFIGLNTCNVALLEAVDESWEEVLLRCDSTGDLYPVTHPSLIPHAFLVNQQTWHQRLGHLGGDVLRRLVSNHVISCNNEKPPVLCHACQLGKHVRLPFVNGTLSHYKDRLVANGGTQLEGVDVDETFSPVVKLGTIQIVLSLAASRHWLIHQLDVKNAFLHGDLSEIGTDTAYLLLYVDDIVLTASFEGLLQRIIRSLHQEFAMTDLGPLKYFLGISVMRDSSGLFLSQKNYAVEILEKAHMVNCNPSRTPVDTESKLGVDGDLIFDPTLYRSLAGSLQYLTFTRTDISYVGTLHYGLQLFSSSTTDLVAYSDADWAGCPTTRRSTSRYCVFLGNNLLSWSSKRQPTLSHSSAKAEYRGVANVVAETCWLRNLLHKLHTPLSSATLVYCDNVSAVYLSCNPV